MIERILVGLIYICLTSASANALTFNFSQSGFQEGAAVTGSFIGSDLDNNGQISSFAGEVTDFDAMFSGNSSMPAFSFDFINLFGLVYDLDGSPILGDGLTFDIEGVGAISVGSRYTAGIGPLALCNGVDICGLLEDRATGIRITTTHPVLVSAVPIPAALPLFATALAGMGFMGWRRRRGAQAV